MRAWWGRRSRWAKIGLIVLVSFLAIGIIGALADTSDQGTPAAEEATTEEETTTEEEATTEDEATTEEEEETTTEEASETTTEEAPPEPAGPRPIVKKGSGSKVVSVRLTEDSPLVVTGTHSGSANFIVELKGRGGADYLVFNEIGNYRGQFAIADILAGRYRAAVDADGSWNLRFEQPVPPANAKTIPGRVTGRGARVVPLRSSEDLEPLIQAVHRGDANFIVEIIGYGVLSGSNLLFNELEQFRGEIIGPEMPAGDYLLAVQADGAWSIRFRP
jgi:hypothetical protein